MDPMLTDYLTYMQMAGLKPRTRYCRERTLVRLSAWLPVPLADATPQMLAAWRASFRLCSQSVANYVTDARQFYAWLQEVRRARPDNPAAGLPVPRRGRRLPRPVTTADLVAAILSAPDRIRAWLFLAAFMGLRSCEIAGLRRECVLEQLACPSLLIAADATKGDEERLIPLTALVLRALGPLPASGWMFTRADGKPGPNTPHTVSATANRHLRAWGVTLHQLRHWFGTTVYDATEDLLGLAELMGHKDLDSTRGYAKISAARKARIMAALPIPAELAA